MAGDLAQLGIQVDSSQAKAASGDLDRLASSASGAQKATDSLRDANTSATGATAQSAAATKALRDAIASNATVTAEMIQAAGGWTAAQKIMSDASRNTASTIAKSAETQIAANDAVAASAAESAAVQVAAHGAVAGSSVKIRESLVLLREASVGNYTRMAGSASILIGAFGLMEAVLVPLVAIGGALGAAFAIGAEQINKSSGDLTKGLGLTKEQLDKVTQKTVTFKDVALATFQVLGKDLTSNFSGVVSDIGKDFGAIAYDGELSVAAIAGGFSGAYQGIKATWNLLPSVLGDAFVSSENIALSAIQGLVNGAISGVNTVIDAVKSIAVPGSLASQMKDIGFIDLGQVKNDYAGAGATAASAFSNAFKKGFSDASAATTQFFTDVANQAKKNRIADIMTEAGKAAVKTLKDLSDQADSIINKYADQYEKQSKAYDDFHAKLAEEVVLAGESADERARSVAEQKEIKLATEMGIAPQLEMVDALVQQRQEAERLQKVSEGVTNSFQDFFTTVFSGGKNAFHNLVDSIKNQFAQLLAWMVVKAIAQPIIVPVIEAVTGGAMSAANLLGAGGSLAGAGSGGIGSIFGSLGSIGSAGGSLAGASGFLGGIGSQISGATSWLTSGINNLGASLGFSPGTVAGPFGAGSFSLPGTSSMLGGSTLLGTLGSAGLGYGLGSMGASLLGGNSSSAQQTNGMIGSALGAAIGSIIPGVGTLLGSALGGVLGGLIGPKDSAHRATANFDANYAVTGITGTKMTDQSQSAATQAGQSVAQVVQALQGAGIHLTNSIEKLTISQTRDRSFITTSTGQRVDVGKVGDVNSAVQGTIAYLTDGMKSANKQVQQVIDHYQALGGITADNAQQFGDDITFAKSLAATTHQVTFQLGGAADALKQVKAAYDADIERAKSLGVSTSQLLVNEQKDIKAMASSFNASVKSQFLSITDPVLASFDQISAAAKALISDARAIGGNLKQAQALNAATMQQFIARLSDADKAALIASGDLTHSQVLAVKAVRSLSDGIDKLITSATDAASAAQQASQAWTSAQQSLDQSRKALLVSGPGVSPQNAYLAAQQQYADLLKKAKTDPQAASDFASFASQFLQTSLTYNATGGQFGADQAKVQSDLASLSSLAGTQATAATNLATQAQAQVDALNIIKDQLASGGPSLSVLQQQLKTQQDLNTTMLAVLGQLGGHRAAGGSVTAGMSYLVGENRAEMFTPGVSGSISPSVAMPARGAFNDNGNAELRAEIRELRAALVKALAENGNGLKRVESAVTKTGGDQVAALSGVKGELKHASGMTSLHGKARKSRAG